MKQIGRARCSETGNIKLILVVVIVVVLVAFYFWRPKSTEQASSGQPSPVEVQKKDAPDSTPPAEERESAEPAQPQEASSEDVSSANELGYSTEVFENVAPTTVVDVGNLEESEETFEKAEPVHQPLTTPLPKSEEVDRRPESSANVSADYKPQVAPVDGYSSREDPVPFVSTIEDGRAGTAAGGTPPDTHGAVGPAHILTVSNGNFSVTPRAVGSTPITVNKLSFFNNLASDLFDPRAVYDQQSDRFYVAMVANRRSASSAAMFAVSTTSDPNGTWRVWMLDFDSTNVNWADYPSLGYSSDKITVSINMFSSAADAFGGIKVFTLNKASAIGTGNLSYGVTTITNAGGTVIPVETLDNSTATQYLIRVGSSNLFGSGRLQLFSLSGSATLPTFTTIPYATLGSAWSISLPNARQLGSTTALIETNDDRLMNAVYRNGKIWTAHTVAMDLTARDRSAVKWWELDATNGLMLQDGFVMDSTTASATAPNATAMHYYYPTISVNKNGDVLIGCSGSSGSTYVGTYYAMRRASDPIGYMDAPVLAKAGTGTVNTSRWGDYSATMVDPVDDTKFWTVQQYAVANGYGLWWTQISSQTDTTAPTVQAASAPNSNTVRVTFNEAMLNNAALRTASNYTFSGGGAALAASAVTVVSATVVDVTVNKMTKSSNYTVSVSTNISDLSGNALSSAARSASFVGAATTVTVTLATSVSAAVTNANPIPFTATFSTTVTGFIATDLTLTNATVSNFSGSGASYSFNLVPSGQGTVAVSVAANAASDGFGNNNGAGAQISKTFDSVKPIATFASTSTNPTATSPIPFTVTFQEDVTGFVVADISVVNGTASNFQTVSPQSYSFSVVPTANGVVSVSLPVTRVADIAGNANNASAVYSLTYQNPPSGGGGTMPAFTTTLSCGAGSYVTVAAFSCTVVFGSSVSNFIASDITVTNGSVSALTPASGASYSFTVTAAAQGVVTVRIAAGVATDAATATNAVSATISKTFDNVRPTATFSSGTSNPTNNSTIAVQVTLSEPVATFNASKLVLLNATLSGFTGSGVNYSFNLTPIGQGEVRAEIAVGAIADLAGNTNTANPKLSRTYDSVSPPSPVISVSN